MRTRGRSTSTRLQLDELALAEAEVADERVGVGGEADAREDAGARASRISCAVDEAEAGRLSIREEVGQDRPLREEAELLVDDADTERAGICRRAEL